MLSNNGYNIENSGDFVSYDISLPIWENNAKLSENLKVNGKDFKVSLSMKAIFMILSSIEKDFSKKILLRSRLIWSYMEFRKTFNVSGLPEFQILTAVGASNVWEFLELDLCSWISGDGIAGKFSISHGDWPCIWVCLTGSKAGLVRKKMGWN
jgi:hypothetical protein